MAPNKMRRRLSRKNLAKRQLTKELFIAEAIAVHGDRYDYSRVEYRGLDTGVQIRCPEHGVFIQTPRRHLDGVLCQGCFMQKLAKRNTASTAEFIEKAIAVHGDRYDYSQVIYTNSRTKVKIICRKHGEFWQYPGNHLQGSGCPQCNGGAKEPGTPRRRRNNSWCLY